MATISLTVPDAQVPRIQAALSSLSPPPTVKQWLTEQLKDLVHQYEWGTAQANAVAEVPPPAPLDVT